ncbi:MAG: hypothetical protein ACYDCJ_12360 [Gammaproteobacteria bacterium]
MNRDAVIKAAFFACIAVGDEPSVRSVAVMVGRIRGKGIRLDFVRAWLSGNAKRDTLGIHSEHKPDTPTVLKSPKRDTAGIQGGHLHARAAKVSIVRSTKDSNESLPGIEAPKKPKRTLRPEDVAAWDITAAAYPIVAARFGDLGMTQTDWKKHNKRAALSLHAAGKTPAEVTAMLSCAYTHPDATFYREIVHLDRLQSHWPKLQAIARGQPSPNGHAKLNIYDPAKEVLL